VRIHQRIEVRFVRRMQNETFGFFGLERTHCFRKLVGFGNDYRIFDLRAIAYDVGL
jgi:hypothetical protein